MKALLVAALLLSCGVPVETPTEAAILVGAHTIEGELTSRDGSCGVVPGFFGVTGDFDTAGQMKSPVPGIDCVFRYGSTNFSATCNGLTYHVEATGRVNKTSAFGNATITGNGCTAGVSFSIVEKR